MRITWREIVALILIIVMAFGVLAPGTTGPGLRGLI